MKCADTQTKKIPAVVQRVQQLFEHYNLNASSATKALGYSTTSKLYSILGGAEPSYPTLVDFLTQWPNISADWLMLGVGPMLRSATATDAPAPKPTLNLTKAASQKGVSGFDRILTITVDEEGKETIPFVPVLAQAGYVRQYNEPVYKKQLRYYRLPGFEFGTFCAFEVFGDSMEPTINHRDIVIVSPVERLDLLTPGDIYVVVTEESVMLKRIRERIMDRSEMVRLYSDNPAVLPYELPAADIGQLWRVRGYLSTLIPSFPEITAERIFQVIETLGFDRAEVRRHLEEQVPE
ncbi:S24 family peptidase [Hymenobacter aerophilus]|uniref:S24 family peptidase n=1 Tax=Hymenobacter aerophilus TaxID=119644 RepID=UPI00039B5AF1|nr:LexA family transcriptional regulator [Hymenobacter aerophilus]